MTSPALTYPGLISGSTAPLPDLFVLGSIEALRSFHPPNWADYGTMSAYRSTWLLGFTSLLGITPTTAVLPPRAASRVSRL